MIIPSPSLLFPPLHWSSIYFTSLLFYSVVLSSPLFSSLLIYFFSSILSRRLHHTAGSQNVIELHGRNDRVVCTSCGYDCSRRIVQKQIEAINPVFLERIKRMKLKELTRVERDGIIRADGDTELGISDFSEVRKRENAHLFIVSISIILQLFPQYLFLTQLPPFSSSFSLTISYFTPLSLLPSFSPFLVSFSHIIQPFAILPPSPYLPLSLCYLSVLDVVPVLVLVPVQVPESWSQMLFSSETVCRKIECCVRSHM